VSTINWSDGRRKVQKVPSSKPVDSCGIVKQDYDYEKSSCKPGKMCGHQGVNLGMPVSASRKLGGA